MPDWAPLADRDPIPGDPNGVAGLARRLSADAESMRSQLQRLAAVDSDEFWCGQAAEEFRNHQKELPDVLEKVVDRFDRVSAALSSYAPGLGEAQSQARTALARAKEAQADIDSATAGMSQQQQQADDAKRAADAWKQSHPNDPPPPPQSWIAPNYSARLDQGRADFEAARRMLEDAKKIRDDAASRCADAIDTASRDDLKNDGGIFHRIGHAVSHFVEEAAPIIGVAAGVLGVAAIFFPVLAPLALAAGALALAVDTYRAVETGEGWGLVAMDAVGLATFGIGRAFSSLAKGVETVSEAERGAAALKATTGVKGALTGLRETSATGNVLTGAAARSAKIARLEGTVEDFNEASKLKYFPKTSQWRSAFSPQGISEDLKGKWGMLKAQKLGALPESFNEMRAEGGLARGAWNGTRLDRTALVLHDVDLGVEAGGGVLAGVAGRGAAQELFAGHEEPRE